jgi:16S rRNA (adenine(1408)-N(1))-methyltransferase
METIRGKVSREFGMAELKQQLAGYDRIILDIGTGDGRYARYLAESQASSFVIGVDACRENLHEQSRRHNSNLLFVIAEAQALPCELNGLASHLAINFPWGSLLDSLLSADPALMSGLASVSRSGATVDVRLNAGALAEAGCTLEIGADRIHAGLSRSGWAIDAPKTLDTTALRKFHSTWARRLAIGRDPRAVALGGYRLR